MAKHAFIGPPRKSWDLATHLTVALTEDALKRQLSALNTPEDVQALRDGMDELGKGTLPKQVTLKEDVEIPVIHRQRAHSIVSSELSSTLDPSHYKNLKEEGSEETKSPLLGDWIEYQGSDAVSKPFRTILYLHGGAYIMGSSLSHRRIGAMLAKWSKARVFLVNYRLAPENSFPSGLEDALASYLYLLEDPLVPRPQDQLVLCGDSAGGGLTLSLRLLLRNIREGPDALVTPAGLSVWSPWVDLTHGEESFYSHAPFDYLPDPRPLMAPKPDGPHPPLWEGEHFYVPTSSLLKHPYVSPLWSPSLEGLGRILVQCGEVERLRDECVKFADRASSKEDKKDRDASCVQLEVYKDMPHVWHSFEKIPLSTPAIRRTAAYIRSITPDDTSERGVRSKEDEEEEGSFRPGRWFISSKDQIQPLDPILPSQSVHSVTDQCVNTSS